MNIKSRFIVLRLTRYSDRSDIVSALGREGGRVSFLVSALRGRGAARQRALMMPMSILEGVYSISPSRAMGRLGDVAPSPPLPGLNVNPVKASVALFMADLLLAVTREGQSDPLVWDYVALSAQTLSAMDGRRVANFPLVFVAGLARLLGIAPDEGGYCRGRVLDLRDGIYRATYPMHTDVADSSESRLIALVTRLNYGNMHRLRLPREGRAALLDGMLRYVSLHHAKVDALRSLPVVRSLFD
ncbi:MAG: DNA repair protein RecO C-terminal domain-containing protein [Pseudoflavonifractor sp.]|nr:DNA repair protein RecO C-terminal domain-containing protein [Alloprevotella sp.]MCM1117173.1 DNA repair protein RecO C-terminal domain-containing protein [Pseudoflavonifractor sp.]